MIANLEMLLAAARNRDRLVMFGKIVHGRPIICLTLRSTPLKWISETIVKPALPGALVVELDVFSLFQSPPVWGCVTEWPVKIRLGPLVTENKYSVRMGFLVTSADRNLWVAYNGTGKPKHAIGFGWTISKKTPGAAPELGVTYWEQKLNKLIRLTSRGSATYSSGTSADLTAVIVRSTW